MKKSPIFELSAKKKQLAKLVQTVFDSQWLSCKSLDEIYIHLAKNLARILQDLTR